MKKLKHDVYLEDLYNNVRPSYDALYTNIPLYSQITKRKIAEIDLLGVKDGKYDVYEVKCSHRIHKAKKQLKKIKRIFPHISNLFFFCGSSGRVVSVV